MTYIYVLCSCVTCSVNNNLGVLVKTVLFINPYQFYRYYDRAARRRADRHAGGGADGGADRDGEPTYVMSVRQILHICHVSYNIYSIQYAICYIYIYI